jgi:hypothetical protein
MKYVLCLVGMLAASPAMAQQANETNSADIGIGGFRVEAHAGIERPNLNESDGNTTYVAKLGSAFAYGAEIGYDIPVSDSFTVGPYASYDFANSDICDSAAVPTGNLQVCFDAKSVISGGLRGGVAVGENGELYASLGYAKYAYDYSEVVRNGQNQIVRSYANDDGDEGIDVGFGYNHMISGNVYAGLGMRITELGNFEGTSLNLQRFQGQVNLGLRF